MLLTVSKNFIKNVMLLIIKYCETTIILANVVTMSVSMADLTLFGSK